MGKGLCWKENVVLFWECLTTSSFLAYASLVAIINA